MHEASLMADLLRKIREVAAAEGGGRVVGVEVWLGALSHLSEAHFLEHFRQATAGTPLEGAAVRATLSDETGHPNAQDVLLQSLELES